MPCRPAPVKPGRNSRAIGRAGTGSRGAWGARDRRSGTPPSRAQLEELRFGRVGDGAERVPPTPPPLPVPPRPPPPKIRQAPPASSPHELPLTPPLYREE